MDFSVQGTMAFLLCLNWVYLLVDMLMIMMQVSADSHFPNVLACMHISLLYMYTLALHAEGIFCSFVNPSTMTELRHLKNKLEILVS